MHLGSWKTCVLAAALATPLVGGAAKADVYVSLTATGTLTTGTDSLDLFGITGSVTGTPFTVTDVFDVTTSTYGNYGSVQQLSPGYGQTTVTINGQTVQFSSSYPSSGGNLFALSAGFQYVGSDEVQAGIDSATASQSTGIVLSDSSAFLPSADLSQATTLSGTNNYQTSSFGFDDLSENLSGTIDAITFNGSSESVPEPASLSLFGAGLLGLWRLRGRRTA
jgi:hypothetical protein